MSQVEQSEARTSLKKFELGMIQNIASKFSQSLVKLSLLSLTREQLHHTLVHVLQSHKHDCTQRWAFLI